MANTILSLSTSNHERHGADMERFTRYLCLPTVSDQKLEV